MAEIKINGVVTNIYPPYYKEDILKSQEFDIEEETFNGDVQTIRVKVLPKRMNEDYALLCALGSEVTITCNLTSREYQGRIYYELLMRKIEHGNTTGTEKRKPDAEFVPCVAAASVEEELPL